MNIHLILLDLNLLKNSQLPKKPRYCVYVWITVGIKLWRQRIQLDPPLSTVVANVFFIIIISSNLKPGTHNSTFLRCSMKSNSEFRSFKSVNITNSWVFFIYEHKVHNLDKKSMLRTILFPIKYNLKNVKIKLVFSN